MGATYNRHLQGLGYMDGCYLLGCELWVTIYVRHIEYVLDRCKCSFCIQMCTYELYCECLLTLLSKHLYMSCIHDASVYANVETI